MIFTTFPSRTETQGTRFDLPWGDFVLMAAAKSKAIKPDLAQYKALTPEGKNKFKDGGGFIAAAFTGDKRNRQAVESLSCITLDVDHLPMVSHFGEETIKDKFPNFSFLLYSTISHTPLYPRYRLIFPLAEPERDVSRWKSAAQCIAKVLGVYDYTDSASYREAQLMFWQRYPSDIEPVMRYAEAEPIVISDVLSTYADLVPTFSAPEKSGFSGKRGNSNRKQDPADSSEPVIADFCKLFSPIEKGLEALFSDIYAPRGGGIYDYIPGHGVGGVRVLSHSDDGENCYLISWHATDPASYDRRDPAVDGDTGGHIYNIFDLMRLHRCDGDYRRALKMAEWLLLTERQ